jgi:hypothetical protein
MSTTTALTMDDIRTAAAALPAAYVGERQAHVAELTRLKRYHELVAEESMHGGSISSALPEELDTRVREAADHLARAKAAAFDRVYRTTFGPDLDAECAALRAALTTVVEHATSYTAKHAELCTLTRAHGARIDAAVINADDLLFLRAMLDKIEARPMAQPIHIETPRPRLTPAAILARVLGMA